MKTEKQKWVAVRSASQESPLPDPFVLPRNYPPVVTAALQKKLLIGNARARFFHTIASAIFYFKGYPTSEEYRRVSEAILAKYPFLIGAGGSPHV